jgi:hypothetical protein
MSEKPNQFKIRAHVGRPPEVVVVDGAVRMADEILYEDFIEVSHNDLAEFVSDLRKFGLVVNSRKWILPGAILTVEDITWRK